MTAKSAEAFGISDSEPLRLNPGPPPRRRSTVTCKCIFWSLFVVCAAGGGYLGGVAGYAGYRHLREPHRALYQDLTVPYRPQDVVRPLVDRNQTFDIVATVWLRTEREPVAAAVASTNEKIARENDGESVVEEEGNVVVGEEDLVKLGEVGKAVEEDDSQLFERAIFSETIFHGIRLKDKKVQASLKLRVPTDIFKKRELNTYDLRASFVLIPTPPSTLNQVANYSTWLPDAVKFPPSRSWPEGYTRTLAEEVVDAYGTFTPLLTFQNIKSRCESSSNSTTGTSLPSLGDDYDEDEEEDAPTTNPAVLGSSKNRFSSQGKPVLEAHPYIITRSFLRVVDMTELYNRKAYDKAHKQLKMTSCGDVGALKILAVKTGKPDWRSCVRSFRTHGNQEVKIKLMKKNEETGKDVAEWVYAPYLSVTETGAGPLDLVPIPVNREECRNQSSTENQSTQVPDEDFVNITWNVSFIGRTPEKLVLADFVSTKLEFNMTDTERNRLLTHSNLETSYGLFGHSFRDDYHPRRIMVLTIIGMLFFLAEKVLEFHYWYSRASTVGIAVTGTAFISGGLLLDYVFETVSDGAEGDYSIGQWIWGFLFNALFQITTLLMLKAVTRAEFHWWKSWVPFVRFAPASHSERASQRLESQISRSFLISIFLTIAALSSIIDSQKFYIINPRGIPYSQKTSLSAAVIALQSLTVVPAMTLGRIIQVIMNSRSRRFAGTYKPCTVLSLVGFFFTTASMAPSIIGEPTDSHGLGVFALTEAVFMAALAFQAFKYPAVSQVDEDEDTR
ncbi:hypothetical protein GALMADRAFT_232296 [Galerina marginata CBS 339.88]|uniref:Uncharacterized protein n=1 Tax=Galerina marginata (strain CBS 339.88) TaxID=685588 RepID=A0A067S7T0_GALM3|nr:hypothetical protein GALMADRAFT_232296 [Galerina marginata CBS 339.88]